MKQISVIYTDDAALQKDLVHVRRQWEQCGHNLAICQILSPDTDAPLFQKVCAMLEEKLPGLLYYGSSCHGIIDGGKYTPARLTLSFTLYEDSTSQAKIFQFNDFDTNSLTCAAKLVAFCHKNSWINSVELIACTLRPTNLSEFCRALEVLDQKISIFGGVACMHDIAQIKSLCFSNGYEPCDHALLAIVRGGPNLHTTTVKVYGWTPMGRELLVTRSKGGTLYELDHQPAFNIYRKYLNIEPDENLFLNVIEFPLYMKRRGQTAVLCSLDVNEDNSLNISADIPEGTYIRLAYGDPNHMLADSYAGALQVSEFTPQHILVYSCGARRTFWGDKMVSKETQPLNAIAPTTGCYGHGEIIRNGRVLMNYNDLMVIAAFREGPVGTPIKQELLKRNVDRRNYNLRLGHFISVASQELEESVRELRRMAITDGLTQLYNRMEIQRRIDEAALKCQRTDGVDTFSLVMIDVDDFKQINDTHGHQEGDDVLRSLSAILRKTAEDIDGASAGRWGGEEFMLLLQWLPQEIGMNIAEKIRAEFETVEFPLCGKQTISIGVTEYKPGDTSATICSRVDKALYIAKEAGKNRVCLL